MDEALNRERVENRINACGGSDRPTRRTGDDRARPSRSCCALGQAPAPWSFAGYEHARAARARRDRRTF